MSARTARYLAAALSAVAVALAVTAVVMWPSRGAGVVTSVGTPEVSGPPATIGEVSAGVPAVEVPITSTDPSTAPKPSDRVIPATMTVDALEVTMPVIPVGLDPDGLLVIPEEVGTAGWFRFGGVPGDRTESSLIAAHVSSLEEGFGPFSELGELAVGDAVVIELSDGTEVPYAVVRREQISKLVIDFEEITAGSPGLLVMVTCGGEWDPAVGSYDDNVVVWAAPTEVP